MASTFPGQAWSQAPQPMQVASIQKCPMRVRAIPRAYASTGCRRRRAASWAGARLPPLQTTATRRPAKRAGWRRTAATAAAAAGASKGRQRNRCSSWGRRCELLEFLSSVAGVRRPRSVRNGQTPDPGPPPSPAGEPQSLVPPGPCPAETEGSLPMPKRHRLLLAGAAVLALFVADLPAGHADLAQGSVVSADPADSTPNVV